MKRHARGFLATILAGLGLAGALAALAVVVVRSGREAVAWAQLGLDASAAHAARILDEPLRTQDIPAVLATADHYLTNDIYMVVRNAGRGGVFFDNRVGVKKGEEPPPHAFLHSGPVRCGEYSVTLAYEFRRVVRPFTAMLPMMALALLVGIAGMLFIFYAFYRQRSLLHEQERRLADLDRLDRERREFIADFSHELKTPLTGILGAAEMLGETVGENAAERRLAEMVVKESKRLDSLAQRILDLSRLERGEVSSGERETLIREAVDNLIENAKRHSGTDDIVVSEEVRGGLHRWIVEDHGIGVPEEYRERIFERFFRVDPARAAESGGAGLGLAIVRRIARNLGGDCICEAACPHGARFVFSVREA